MQTIRSEKFPSQTVTIDPPHTLTLVKTKEHQYFED